MPFQCLTMWKSESFAFVFHRVIHPSHSPDLFTEIVIDQTQSDAPRALPSRINPLPTFPTTYRRHQLPSINYLRHHEVLCLHNGRCFFFPFDSNSFCGSYRRCVCFVCGVELSVVGMSTTECRIDVLLCMYEPSDQVTSVYLWLATARLAVYTAVLWWLR